MTPADERVCRSYRRARTYPRTIRKLSGIDLPYPVTIPQLATWVVVFVFLWYSTPLWITVAGSARVVVLLAVPTTAAIIVRHLRLEGRSPVAMASGLLALALAPRTGAIHGRRAVHPSPTIYAARIPIEERT